MCTPSVAADRLEVAERLERWCRAGPRRARPGGWCRWACPRRRRRARRPARPGHRSGPRPRRWRPLLRGQAERAGVGAGDAPPVGDALGALELRGELVAAEVGLGMGTPSPSLRDEFEPMGTRDMSSTPQATATSTTPEPTRLVATLVACCEEPHWVSTVVAAVVSGRPALSHAVRPMLNDCSPTWLTHPVTTWPTSAGRCPSGPPARSPRWPAARPGARSTARRCGGRRGSGRLRRSRRRSWPANLGAR